MDATSALTELEALAKKLEVEVIYDHLTGEGMGPGGLCKVKGRWRVIIERRSSPGERLSILAKALSRFDLESHFLSPSVRELVERYLPPEKQTHHAPPAAAPPADLPAASVPAAGAGAAAPVEAEDVVEAANGPPADG
jgi:hypothetical protein